MTSPSPFRSALADWSATGALGGMRRACDAAAADGDPRGTEHASCTLLGLVYSAGEGVPRDARRAARVFEQAARGGLGLGARDLASASGLGIKTSAPGQGSYGGRGCADACDDECAVAREQVRSEIEPSLVAACRRASGVACFLLSRLTDEGDLLPEIGQIRARTRLERPALVAVACQSGVGPACAERAWTLDVGQDASLAQACSAGWGASCLRIGQKLGSQGRFAAAVGWWERACELGLNHACNDLGDILSSGEGVPLDHDRAAHAYAEGWRF